MAITAQDLQGQWNRMKGQVKQKWGHLTDDDLQISNGNIDQLVGRIQQKTGDARAQIETFLSELTSRQRSAVAQAAETVGDFHSARDRLRDTYGNVSGMARERYEQAQDSTEGMLRTRIEQEVTRLQEDMLRTNQINPVALAERLGISVHEALFNDDEIVDIASREGQDAAVLVAEGGGRQVQEAIGDRSRPRPPRTPLEG